jgi:hypothetical protein
MKKISLILVLLVVLLVASVSVQAAPPLPDLNPIDVGSELRGWKATPDRIQSRATALAPQALAASAAASTLYDDCFLETKEWLSLDDYNGQYFFDDFYLIAETAGSELWVQADLSYPDGDPRETPVVTCEQAAYLLSEFDNNMYPVETDFFGTPDIHDGSASLLELWGLAEPGTYANEDGRQVVLVSNVRDDAYYDSTYPNYIAGFYSPTFEAYFDRNIMSIDSHDWANRVGPDGSRPYLYESVFAHEYQHLLHDDYDSDEENFINEGLSMFAEYLTGYVVDNDPYSTFEALPENSLVAWGDQGGREIVADYGMVFLFQMYLYEKLGQEFIQYEFHNQDNGISSINSTLEALGIPADFGDAYHSFAVAVLIDSRMNRYRYGFDLLDVGIDIGTLDAPNPDAYDTPGAPPWGTDYIWLDGNNKKISTLYFDGADTYSEPTPWTSDGDVLWGGDGDEIDNWAIFETVGGGTLTFDTYYDIEEYWDFGFVQASTDGGATWTSLENASTTFDYDPNAYPKVIENLPGLTGTNGDWANMSFDLSAYAGQDILLAFRYVTDWGTTEVGWYVDNVYVDGTLISDGSNTDAFKSLTELFPVELDFTVTLVGIKNDKSYKVRTMALKDDATEQGIFLLNTVMNRGYDDVVMLVTFDAPEGFTGYADYTYEVNNFDHGHWWPWH